MKKLYVNVFIPEEETTGYWMRGISEIKERGVKDILFICTDGVSGFKEILEQVYPKTIYQRCIVHIIRNLTPCVQKKDKCKNYEVIFVYQGKPLLVLKKSIRR